jgi:hypothetical protein
MISPEVMQELLSVRQVLHYLPESASDKGWTEQEQHLFWVALTQHPQGPWTTIAEFIGTKSARQAMTHGQKLRQKLKRWNERLRSNPTASMLMDEVNVSTTADVAVTAGISVEAMSTMSVDVSSASPALPVPTPAHAGGLQPGFTVDGVSIVEMDGLHLGDIELMGAGCGAPSMYMGFPVQDPNGSISPPHVSADATRVVELMLSESSEEVTVTDFSDDPEMLPQDLLDDLLDILSDDDLNELNNHHHQHPNMLG